MAHNAISRKLYSLVCYWIIHDNCDIATCLFCWSDKGLKNLAIQRQIELHKLPASAKGCVPVQWGHGNPMMSFGDSPQFQQACFHIKSTTLFSIRYKYWFLYSFYPFNSFCSLPLAFSNPSLLLNYCFFYYRLMWLIWLTYWLIW